MRNTHLTQMPSSNISTMSLEWVPAKGHVVLIRSSDQLWCARARLKGGIPGKQVSLVAPE
jgi:hypothetical protein